jgi:hypothetical protein
VRNEQVKTFNEVAKVAKKKQENVKENFTTNYTIHGENKSFRSELSHGIGHGTYDKFNESIEPPFIVTKS